MAIQFERKFQLNLKKQTLKVVSKAYLQQNEYNIEDK